MVGLQVTVHGVQEVYPPPPHYKGLQGLQAPGTTSTCSMKLLALLATLAAVSAQSPETIYKNFLRGIDAYNFRAKCWGEKNADGLAAMIDAAKKTCMQMDEGEHESSEETSSEEDLPRSRRQVEELAGFQESVDEFAAQFADFQGGLSSSISNLSCVLKGLQMLKHDGSVNLDFWTTALTDPEKAVFDYTIEGSAASDPVWRQRFSEANLECYVLSQSFPADSLTHDPVSATLGRPAIFFKCWNVSTPCPLPLTPL